MNSIAVYPGAFDPVTLGHVDLIRRASSLFDRLVVAVLQNAEKVPLFEADHRAEMVREATRDLPNVEVAVFDGLLVEFARSRGARLIVRGLRAISDFEYELQMAMMNRRLHPDLETVFMTPGEDYSYLSSRLVREVAHLGGRVDELVPPVSAAALAKHFGGTER
jgi:pantetheine-phosphate adenylyltransferase